MFAVPGWNLGTLKSQTEAPKAVQSRGDSVGKDSKKRKRGGQANVTTENVAKLWDRHVEGKESVRKFNRVKGTAALQKKRTAGSPEEQLSGNSKKAKRQRTDGNFNSQGSDGHDTAPQVTRTGSGAQDQSSQGVLPGETHDRSKARKQKELAKPVHAKEKIHKSWTSEWADAVQDERQRSVTSAMATASAPLPHNAKLTPMQSAMRQKLISARFRHLNQTLYTENSSKALKLFDENPEMFNDYHAGFRQQVEVWPENPLDFFIGEIKRRGALKQPYKGKKDRGGRRALSVHAGDIEPLPRTHGTAIISDLGCGDARLARTLISSGDAEKFNLKLSSFDLGSNYPIVTKADISNLPIGDGAVDVAIFCLALMGTNWLSFIEEAYRILHWKGELWIAEIKSRFGRINGKARPVDHSVGGKKKQVAAAKANAKKQAEEEEQTEQQVLAMEVDGVDAHQQETDVSAFVDVLRRRGFVLKEGQQGVDLSNKMFVKMEFIKAAAPSKGKGVSEAVDTARDRKVLTKKPKFLTETEKEPSTDDEAKVLKPCLYKLR